MKKYSGIQDSNYLYKYYYEILPNGYNIYKDNQLIFNQEEPFIPNKKLTYEQNAIQQIEELSGNPITAFTSLEDDIKEIKHLLLTLLTKSENIEIPEISLDSLEAIE